MMNERKQRRPDFDGYLEAAKIDKRINKLLTTFTMTGNGIIVKDEAIQWLKFARTVRTTCELIEMQAMKVLTDK